MKPLSVVVRTVCDFFAWFMVVFGVYVIVHGHLTPGGGFQGGAVVATFVTLLLVAYGGEKVLSWIKVHLLDSLETSGLLIFLGAGFLGISSAFFYNVLAKSGGLFGSSVHRFQSWCTQQFRNHCTDEYRRGNGSGRRNFPDNNLHVHGYPSL